MKFRLSRWTKLLCLAGALALTVTTAGVLFSSPADAGPGPVSGPIGGPLCGWSALWDCTLPDGKVVTIGGTQCDIARFERRTGATCELKTF